VMQGSELTKSSRGHLVLDVATSTSLAAACDHLMSMHPRRYRCFHLLVADERGEGWLWSWNGQSFTRRGLDEVELPVTTSSYCTEEVLAARQESLRSLTERNGMNEESLRAFHRSRHSRGGAYSVTMTRDDAMTWSLSRVQVGPERITFDYAEREKKGEDPDYLPGVTVSMAREELD
jgi:hypothetical protein